jgi:hypothetical protein
MRINEFLNEGQKRLTPYDSLVSRLSLQPIEELQKQYDKYKGMYDRQMARGPDNDADKVEFQVKVYKDAIELKNNTIDQETFKRLNEAAVGSMRLKDLGKIFPAIVDAYRETVDYGERESNPSVNINSSEKFSFSHPWADGYRVVNILYKNGKAVVLNSEWSGNEVEAMRNGNIADSGKSIELKPGEVGLSVQHGQKNFCHLYIHPDNVNKLITSDSSDLNNLEKVTLMIMRAIKGGYRMKYFMEYVRSADFRGTNFHLKDEDKITKEQLMELIKEKYPGALKIQELYDVVLSGLISKGYATKNNSLTEKGKSFVITYRGW